MLGLDADHVVARIRAHNLPVATPGFAQSLMVGTIGFTLVSVLMFSVWALAGAWMYRTLGEGLFYSLLAGGFMLGGGAVFKPVLAGVRPSSIVAVFVIAFMIYAATWIACWFTIRETGEWVAGLLGPALMGMLFAYLFAAPEQMWRCCLALVLGHTAGYFIGRELFAWEPLANQYGMLIWGLTYGIGFGAGISASFYWCQAETRRRLHEIAT